MGRGILAALACAAAMACAGQASAAVIMGTFTGNIFVGTPEIDVDGTFGTPGADLAGDLFKLVFSFEADAATIANGELPSGETAPGSIALTIGGVTLDDPVAEIGAFRVRIRLSPVTHDPLIYHISFAGGVASGPTSHGYVFADADPLPASFVSNVSNDPVFTGDFLGDGRLINLFPTFDEAFLGNVTHFEFNIPAATAVPEPTSWSLLLLGVGVLGGALRRRYCAAACTDAGLNTVPSFHEITPALSAGNRAPL